MQVAREEVQGSEGFTSPCVGPGKGSALTGHRSWAALSESHSDDFWKAHRYLYLGYKQRSGEVVDNASNQIKSYSGLNIFLEYLKKSK